MASKRIGIITRQGIEEKEVEVGSKPLIIVGHRVGKEKKERKAIRKAFSSAGFETYAALNNPWPNDAYVYHNGLYLPGSEFGDVDDNGSVGSSDGGFNDEQSKVAHGGNYIFGDKFVLVSSAIKQGLEKLLKDHKHAEKLFQGKEIVYINPYDAEIKNEKGDIFKPGHIDLTIGYVQGKGLLCIDANHCFQIEDQLQELKEKYGIWAMLSFDDDPDGFSFYPNNFYVVQMYNNENPVVVANPCRDFHKRLQGEGIKVFPTRISITEMASNRGSIKCAVNQVHNLELLDRMGIEYSPRTAQKRAEQL